jgi:hypothetical protein
LAETFWCDGERVKFSNGATELLFRHWLAKAEERSDTPEMPTVAAYLRHRLTAFGDGGRVFGMDRDRFPAELMSPNAVSALAVLVTESARDATRIEGIDWRSQYQAWWESRLQQLA